MKNKNVFLILLNLCKITFGSDEYARTPKVILSSVQRQRSRAIDEAVERIKLILSGDVATNGLRSVIVPITIQVGGEQETHDTEILLPYCGLDEHLQKSKNIYDVLDDYLKVYLKEIQSESEIDAYYKLFKNKYQALNINLDRFDNVVKSIKALQVERKTPNIKVKIAGQEYHIGYLSIGSSDTLNLDKKPSKISISYHLLFTIRKFAQEVECKNTTIKSLRPYIQENFINFYKENLECLDFLKEITIEIESTVYAINITIKEKIPDRDAFGSDVESEEGMEISNLPPVSFMGVTSSTLNRSAGLQGSVNPFVPPSQQQIVTADVPPLFDLVSVSSESSIEGHCGKKKNKTVFEKLQRAITKKKEKFANKIKQAVSCCTTDTVVE